MKNTEHAQLYRELAQNVKALRGDLSTFTELNDDYFDRTEAMIAQALQAAEEIEGRKAPALELVVKPCGDCWLHIKAPSGRQAAINLGQRGSFNDQTFIGPVIREVAELTRFGAGEAGSTT